MTYGLSFIDGGIKQSTEVEAKSAPNITFNVHGGGGNLPAMKNINFTSLDGGAAPQATRTFDELLFSIPTTGGSSLVPGSMRFTFNGEAYVERNALLYKNINAANGSGTEVGAVDLNDATIIVDTWAAGADPHAVIDAGLMQFGDTTISQTCFRSPVAPIRPGSFSLIATRAANNAVVQATADSNGIIDTANIVGKVDYESGVAQIFFGRKTGEAWEPSIDISSLIPGVTAWYPDPVYAATARFSLVAYTYLPLDADILGIDPVRLPTDGRVPIFRVGDVAVVHHTDSVGPVNVSNGQTVDTTRTRLARVRVVGANGNTITAGYTADLDAGTVTFTDVAGYSQPVTVESRIEDMALVSEVQINGQLAFTRQLTHDYPADETIVSSALIIGDMRSRVSVMFDQATWSSVWQDVVNGSAAPASYNDTLYPIALTNSGTITERWVLHFTNTTTFNVIGENVGQIVTAATISADCAPINPATGVPYFTIDKDGWGSGWSAGNAVRFNTVGALAPVWIARTIQQGQPTAPNDSFTVLVRGDVDNP